MGRILCEKHGEQSFYQICEHHYADVCNGIKSKVLTTGIFAYKICENCYEKYSFKEIENYTIDEVLKLPEAAATTIETLVSQKHDLVSVKGICVQCYQEKLNSFNEDKN
ncbi:hypothetical protein [Kordia sp.]|uniref:hypothetical protein n=1 Tax=Kordia sp. TaxID=1965332 RepID=UPI003B5B5A2E